MSFFELESSDNVHLKIYGHKVSNSAAPTTAAEFTQIQQHLTTASVDWHPTSLVWQSTTTPEIASVVNEIVNQSGWASGNSLTIYIGDECFIFLEPF